MDAACLKIMGESRVKPDRRVKWSVSVLSSEPAPTMSPPQKREELVRYKRDDILSGIYRGHQPSASFIRIIIEDSVYSLLKRESRRTFHFARILVLPYILILFAQTWSCLGRKIVEEAHSAPPLSYKRGVISRRGSRVDNFSRNEDRTHSFAPSSASFSPPRLCLSLRDAAALPPFLSLFAPRFVRGINRERDNVVARASCMTNDTDMACLHEPSRR